MRCLVTTVRDARRPRPMADIPHESVMGRLGCVTAIVTSREGLSEEVWEGEGTYQHARRIRRVD